MQRTTVAWLLTLGIVGAIVYALTRPNPLQKRAELVPELKRADPQPGATGSGLLRQGPTVSEFLAPIFPQLHKSLDGIPGTGLAPTVSIASKNNPDLELNPITAFRFYLQAIPQAAVVMPNESVVRWAGPELQNLGVVS